MAWNYPWGVGPEDIDNYYRDDPDEAEDEEKEEDEEE